ncbi:hypothetical protein ACA910_018238 [Epithemia clementina (nom. ined.)]
MIPRPWLSCLISLFLFVNPARSIPDDALDHHVLIETRHGVPHAVLGKLGKLPLNPKTSLIAANEVKHLVSDAIPKVFGGTGNESFEPVDGPSKSVTDSHGDMHFRFIQSVKGIQVENARIAVHVAKDGTIMAMNGEFVEESTVPTTTPELEGKVAMQRAMKEAFHKGFLNRGGSWENPNFELTITYAQDERAYLCFKNTYRFEEKDDKMPQRAIVYASALEPSRLVLIKRLRATAHHPRLSLRHQMERQNSPSTFLDSKNARSLDTSPRHRQQRRQQRHRQLGNDEKRSRHLQTPSVLTYDCQFRTERCILIANNSATISTGDTTVDSAHNGAIVVFNTLISVFGRNSIDNMGMPLISRVRYNVSFNNAFWDGFQMTYGDGDGVTLSPLSGAIDVVAHEFTHGITFWTSDLIYEDDPGALNEAFSDFMGAFVDRQQGASIEDTWLVGEDIFTPFLEGDAIRNMADPASRGDMDYYPSRYIGDIDSGGVHTNSGIANLAFQLVVEGGTHPRGATSINVPAINQDFDTSLNSAMSIFYDAFTTCLTPFSSFPVARFCTADVHGGTFADNIRLAWDAVGVPISNVPPNIGPITLTNNVPLLGQGGSENQTTYYRLDGLQTDQQAQCFLRRENGATGNPRLYLRPDPMNAPSKCLTFDGCLSGIVDEPSFVSILIYGETDYVDFTVQCNIVTPVEMTIGVETAVESGGLLAFFFMRNIVRDNAYDCTVEGTTGDVELFAAFDKGAVPVPGLNTCESNTAGTSNESCITPLSTHETELYVTLRLNGATDARLVCRVVGPQVLENNVVVENLSGQQGEQLFFVFPDVPGSETATCRTEGPNFYDVDLYVKYGSQPTLADFNCSSAVPGSNEVCTTISDTTADLFVLVNGFTLFEGLSLVCFVVTLATPSISPAPSTREPTTRVLENDVVVANLTGQAQTQLYFVLLDVPAGVNTTCQTEGSNIYDVDLYVKYDQRPTSIDFNCSSISFTSNEVCTTSSDTIADLFVLVFSSAFFEGVSLVCFIDTLATPSSNPAPSFSRIPSTTQPPTVSPSLSRPTFAPPTSQPFLSPTPSPQTFPPTNSPTMSPAFQPNISTPPTTSPTFFTGPPTPSPFTAPPTLTPVLQPPSIRPKPFPTISPWPVSKGKGKGKGVHGGKKKKAKKTKHIKGHGKHKSKYLKIYFKGKTSASKDHGSFVHRKKTLTKALQKQLEPDEVVLASDKIYHGSE